ncbi:hypothetical protein H4R19_001663 [Coemansia spiralis]|nr:hypothetical protein H4R19_001663 [Coemansia spiralis]
MLPVFAGRKVHVSRNLTISVMHQSDAIDRGIDIASRMLAESNSYNTRELVICGRGVITPELITYTGLTHLNFFVLMKADDVMGLIHKLPHLICLRVDWLTVADTQTDFSIPECAEHEPVPQLDTQIKRLMLLRLNRGELPELAVSILKYLLLRIPTLKFVTALFAREEPIQAFINEYVQWYPHLANIKFTM